MKRTPSVIFALLAIALVVPVIVAQAAPAIAPAVQEAPTIPTLPDFVETLKNLAGVAALFTAVVNALKRFGLIADNYAPTASLILNAVALIGLVALQISGRIDLVPVIDQSAGVIATIITAVLSLIFQLFFSRKAHEVILAGLPVIGFSHSNRKAGEEVVVNQYDFAE